MKIYGIFLGMDGMEGRLAEAEVVSLDYEGRGVARIGGKTVFVKGALPNERVRCRIVKTKKQYDEAQTVAVLRASSERVEPECRYFDTCGGCVLQHASAKAQVAYKQRIFEEQLQRIGKVMPQQMLPPLYGLPWHYRDRGRLGIGRNARGRLKIGFRAKQSNEVVGIDGCRVMPAHISAKLPALRALLERLTASGQTVSDVEFAVGSRLNVFKLRLDRMPSEKETALIREFFDGDLSDKDGAWQIWLQHGKKPPYPFYPAQASRLEYILPESNIVMPFVPGDFTQVNARMNALMVARVVRLLNVRRGERVADLFCGIGNFTLPLAKQGAEVVGIEGSDDLVIRARNNSVINNCSDATVFQTADLFETDRKMLASWGRFDKMLLDPPRSGALAVVTALHPPYLPQRIVYVSCNPATFARDAAVLVGKGYRFDSAGVMNLFAQTAHVEAVGVFELGNDNTLCP